MGPPQRLGAALACLGPGLRRCPGPGGTPRQAAPSLELSPAAPADRPGGLGLCPAWGEGRRCGGPVCGERTPLVGGRSRPDARWRRRCGAGGQCPGGGAPLHPGRLGRRGPGGGVGGPARQARPGRRGFGWPMGTGFAPAFCGGAGGGAGWGSAGGGGASWGSLFQLAGPDRARPAGGSVAPPQRRPPEVGDDPLHLRHHGPAQGGAAQPRQPVAPGAHLGGGGGTEARGSGAQRAADLACL